MSCPGSPELAGVTLLAELAIDPRVVGGGALLAVNVRGGCAARPAASGS